jgi:hypothetical protein
MVGMGIAVAFSFVVLGRLMVMSVYIFSALEVNDTVDLI